MYYNTLFNIVHHSIYRLLLPHITSIRRQSRLSAHIILYDCTFSYCSYVVCMRRNMETVIILHDCNSTFVYTAGIPQYRVIYCMCLAYITKKFCAHLVYKL